MLADKRDTQSAEEARQHPAVTGGVRDIRRVFAQRQRRQPFRAILIANRGEIALRIIRACRDLGHRDRRRLLATPTPTPRTSGRRRGGAIGPAAGGARATCASTRSSRRRSRPGAEAIHPGYGFLSERAAFARAVVEARARLRRPAADAIEALGDKLAARRTAVAAGVPVVPGTFEAAPVDRADGVDGDRRAAADRSASRCCVKAAAGGGGRGMRRVATPDGACRRRWPPRRRGARGVRRRRGLSRARGPTGAPHRGAAARRRRRRGRRARGARLLDPAPPPEARRGVAGARADARRARELHEMAVRVGAAPPGCTNAATAEFLFDARRRLLVPRGQRAAPGGARRHGTRHRSRPRRGAVLDRRGAAAVRRARDAAARGRRPGRHAIEVRLSAEDPCARLRAGARPRRRWAMPSGPGVRVDTAIRGGERVPPDYDPLIAKIMVDGADDREAAIDRAAAGPRRGRGQRHPDDPAVRPRAGPRRRRSPTRATCRPTGSPTSGTARPTGGGRSRRPRAVARVAAATVARDVEAAACRALPAARAIARRPPWRTAGRAGRASTGGRDDRGRRPDRVPGRGCRAGRIGGRRAAPDPDDLERRSRSHQVTSVHAAQGCGALDSPTARPAVEVVVDGWRFELEVEDAAAADAARARHARGRRRGGAGGPRGGPCHHPGPGRRGRRRAGRRRRGRPAAPRGGGDEDAERAPGAARRHRRARRRRRRARRSSVGDVLVVARVTPRRTTRRRRRRGDATPVASAGAATVRAKALGGAPERRAPFETSSGIEIRDLYTAADTRRPRRGPRPRPARRVPVHPRRPADDVPRAGSGRCASTRASPRPRRRTAASATSSSRARPGCRSRSTCRPRWATTPTRRRPRARSAGSACRSPASPTWRSCSTACRSARSAPR